MRISRSRRTTGGPSHTPPVRTTTTRALLGFSLIAVFALGFLTHQQGWHTALLSGSPTWALTPRAVVASWQARAALPVVALEIRFADYQRLIALHHRAQRLGVHIPALDEAVPATMRFGSERRETVEMRLPGGPVAGVQAELGPMELRPTDAFAWLRLTPVEPTRTEAAWQQWAYLESLRREGFAAATQAPVRLHVNGSDWGLYMLETPAPEESLARFDAQAAWEARAAGEASTESAFRYASVAVEGNASPAVREAVARLRAVQIGAMDLSEVVDAEVVGHFLALTALWTGQPAPNWPSLRWRYDTATGKLAPVGSGQPGADPSPLPDAFLDDPAVQAAYARALTTVSDPAYLEQLRRATGAVLEQQWAVLTTHPPAALWSMMELQQRAMRARLAPRQGIAATLEPDTGGFVLHLTNLQPFPILVVGLDAGGLGLNALDPAWVLPEDRAGLIEDEALVLRAASGSLPQPVRVRLPRTLATAGGDTLIMISRLWTVPGPELRTPVIETVRESEATP